MSMINDALRRASSASRNAAAPPPILPAVPVPPPPPISNASAEAFPPPPPLSIDAAPALPPEFAEEPLPPRSNKTQMLLAVLLVFAVAIAAVVTWWVRKAEKAPVVVNATEGKKAILPHAEALKTAEETVAKITNQAARAEVATVKTSTPLVAQPTPVPPPVHTSPQPPPKFPPLKLQSIFYRPSNPSVMINGKTLYLDDEIQGVTVADIQASSVTLVLSGHTNILTLR